MPKILIVEDDVSVHNILTELLTKENYTLSHAYSGSEAMLLLEKGKYDLILLDLMLPALNGEEIISKNKDTKNTWYTFNDGKQKEVEVERPAISDKFQKELESIRDFFYDLKFWKENNFASYIKIVCNIDEEDVEFVEAKKNHLYSLVYDSKWYTYFTQTKIFTKDYNDEDDDIKTLNKIKLENYEDYKDIVEKLEKSPIKDKMISVNFGELKGEFTTIRMKCW